MTDLMEWDWHLQGNSFFFLTLEFFFKFIFIHLSLAALGFAAARGLSLVVASGGFSCCGAWAVSALASVVVARRLSSRGSRSLAHRLSSCGAQA